jgi:hypothetical protein
MSLFEAIHASNQAEGWLFPAEKTLLYSLAQGVPRDGAIVELGSWMGRSAIMLAKGSMAGCGAPVFAVDVFSTDGGETAPLYAPFLNSGSVDYLATFEQNIGNAGVASLVRPIKSTTIEAARDWVGPRVRFLYIDANHSYRAVRDDFLAWAIHCGPGSWCAFHDYSNPKARGVQRFVDRLLATKILTETGYADSIVYGKLTVTDPDRLRRRLALCPAWCPQVFNCMPRPLQAAIKKIIDNIL